MAELNTLKKRTLKAIQPIVSRHGLTMEMLQKECPSRILFEIASLLYDWKVVGVYLGIEMTSLDFITYQNISEEGRRRDLLFYWKRKAGVHATYIKLAEALYRTRRLDLLEQLCEAIRRNEEESSPTCT